MIHLEQTETLGDALRRRRKVSHISQMELALDAGISPRHLSFIETGRTQPSREVVLQLAGALNLSFRERNSLLIAAGYAPEFGRVSLTDERMTQVRDALDRHLSHHEPYPAIVVNPAYDILLSNQGFRRMVTYLGGPDILDRFANVYRMLFAADGLRPTISCWPPLRSLLLGRLRTEALLGRDNAAWQLLHELEGLGEVEDTAVSPPTADLPVLTLDMAKNGRTFRVFSTITTFGSPLDITTQEIRLESMFPADEATRQAMIFLAEAEQSGK